MPSEACFSMAVWQHEVRPEEEVLGRKRPRSDLGPALTVSLAWGKETLQSTFVSLVALAGSSEASRGTQEAATRGVAWCGVVWRGMAWCDSTPCLPREQPDVLFEPLLPCRDLCPRPGACDPAMGLAASQLQFSQSPAADPVCCLRVTSFLVPASCQPEWYFHLLSQSGEVSCPPPVVGACTSLQGCDPVFLQKAKVNFRAIVPTALLWLWLPGAATQPGTLIDTSLWNCGAPPCFLPVRKVKGLKKKRSRSSFFGLFV